ncbi:hypothetical protein DFQ27_007583 [Actinomortierella ambigua]|uniref:Integral membrane protein S linking to the trans Golgi network-domain-containing protein n=1 Tax=Actinomortierella ambigua TaxID=1343610 RepID=A0A9P6QK80_9FUNG|nr:hypothetical protein DFQ27_007583 [Actinomortierella ambigua]
MATTASSFRGATQWDPVLILSQIACLQSVWYCSISVIVYTLFTLTGTEISLDVILDYREIRFDNSAGLLLGFAWLLNACVGIVSRARLVLDFSLTLLMYHVVMTTLYSDHLPTSFLWWGLNATTAGIMIFGGEYLCMRQEMEPILLGGSGGNSSSTGQDSVRSGGASGAGTATRQTQHARTRSNGTGAIMTAGASSSSSTASSNTALGFIQSQTKASRPAGGGGRYEITGDQEESTGLLMMDSLDHLHHELSHSPGGPGVALSSSSSSSAGATAATVAAAAAGPAVTTGAGTGGAGVFGSPVSQPQGSVGSSSMMTLPQKAK